MARWRWLGLSSMFAIDDGGLLTLSVAFVSSENKIRAYESRFTCFLKFENIKSHHLVDLPQHKHTLRQYDLLSHITLEILCRNESQ